MPPLGTAKPIARSNQLMFEFSEILGIENVFLDIISCSTHKHEAAQKSRDCCRINLRVPMTQARPNCISPCSKNPAESAPLST
jgi:hypothetical protein